MWVSAEVDLHSVCAKPGIESAKRAGTGQPSLCVIPAKDNVDKVAAKLSPISGTATTGVTEHAAKLSLSGDLKVHEPGDL